jgi:hypothetical protein
MDSKFILWALYLLGLFTQSLAQNAPELSRTCAPVTGDSLRYYIAPNPLSFASLLTQSGPARIWNPGNTLLSEQGKVDLYQNATQTPYFLLFGNYGRKIADSSSLFEFLGLPSQLPIPGLDTLNLPLTNLYDFYNLNNNRWAKTAQGIGLFGLPLPIFYSDADEILNFPLRYNERDTSTFAFEINVPTLAQISRSGRRITHADAWGTLTTPYGTFNCLRVRSRTSIQDSIAISGSPPIGLPSRTEIETSWYTNEGGNRGPILQIIERGVLFFPPTVQEVRYRDRYRAPKPPPPPPLTDPGNVILYPNPCQSTLNLGLHPLDPCMRISFIDMQGQNVLDILNPGTKVEHLNLLLAPGCYQVLVEAQYGNYSKRLLIIP